MSWQSPTLTVKWGNYFAPDPAEQKQIVELVKAALEAKTITTRMAVEKLAPIFGIESVELALAEIEKERDESAQRELDAATAALKAAGGTQRPGQNPVGPKPGPNSGGGRPSSGQVNPR
jgi:hypothetical protein